MQEVSAAAGAESDPEGNSIFNLILLRFADGAEDPGELPLSLPEEGQQFRVEMFRVRSPITLQHDFAATFVRETRL